MAIFFPALRRTLINEGVQFGDAGLPIPGKTGFHNDATDRGGLTNYGLILDDLKEAGYSGSLETIPYETVAAIYKTLYWDKMRGDEWSSQRVANEVFDTMVNCGPKTAIRFLQAALNTFNRNQARWPDILEDGVWGSGTSAALVACLALANDMEDVLLKDLEHRQGGYYAAICRKDPTQEANYLGWIRNRT